MNKKFLSLMTAAMVLMAAFASCKKDKDGSGNSGGASVINATVVDGDEYNDEIATVKAMMGYEGMDDWYEDVIASGKYTNGGFKLALPGTVADKYLFSVYGLDGTISDPKAKIGAMETEAYDKYDDLIGEFYYGEYYGSDNWIQYVYADRNVTLQGYYDEYTEFRCSFTKGWNIMYIVESKIGNNYNSLYTTQKPSDINYKWYYHDWKKSLSDKGKHQRSFLTMK